MTSEVNLAVSITANEEELKNEFKDFSENSHHHDDINEPGRTRNHQEKKFKDIFDEKELEVRVASGNTAQKESSLMKTKYTDCERKFFNICNLLECQDSERLADRLSCTRDNDEVTKTSLQSYPRNDAVSLDAECFVSHLTQGSSGETKGISEASTGAKTDPLPIPSKHTHDVSSGEPTLGSPSFIMVREASVEGVFICAPTPHSSSEDEISCAATAVSQQSPFRRQLFTSLMTRQSALVSRISQQTSKIMRAVEAVASITQTDQEIRPKSSSANANFPSTVITEEEELMFEYINEQKPRCNPGVKFHLGESMENGSADQCPLRHQKNAGGARDPLRLVSICDSGIGCESDEDVRSLSRDSSYTLSEDSEGPAEEEGKALIIREKY